MSDRTEAQDILEAGATMVEVREVGDTPFVLAPKGVELKSLESLLPYPVRARGTVTLNDVDSFIAAVKLDARTGTRLYGDLNVGKFIAVFNDHGGAEKDAGWRDHRAIFACQSSVEWQRWIAANGRKMVQADFAAFIEDNLPDIAVPPASEMLEISRTLEAKKRISFASSIRLTNGQNELTYEEQVSGTAAKGKLQIPEQFTIGIPVFTGGSAYAVEARLRYRIGDGGALNLWYDLIRPHKILDDAIEAVVAEIEEATQLTVLNGTP